MEVGYAVIVGDIYIYIYIGVRVVCAELGPCKNLNYVRVLAFKVHRVWASPDEGKGLVVLHAWRLWREIHSFRWPDKVHGGRSVG
jgi:hypothetical protein